MKGKNNPVAKHSRTYNKAVVHDDRKQKSKRGYQKHKNTALTDQNNKY